MKICLVGHYPKYLDEGVRNITFHIYKELSKSNEVMKVDIRNILEFWKGIKIFNPEIIHFIVGPSTTLSFVISKVLSLYFKNAKVIMSAPQPGYLRLKKLISILKPNLILVQSFESEKLFRNLGCKIQFFPNGVEIERFRPVKKNKKNKLRQKYGIEEEKFIILHVGHIKKDRNILLLRKFQRNNNQVIIVGSTSTPIEKDIYNELKESGCLIKVDYFENMEEIYAISDCYVFPTKDRYNCIETPMSVLEAMSCNLPVISTKFGALPRIFDDGDGLIYINNGDKDEDFLDIIERIKNRDMVIKTREKILPYSWVNITKELEGIYDELLHKSDVKKLLN